MLSACARAAKPLNVHIRGRDGWTLGNYRGKWENRNCDSAGVNSAALFGWRYPLNTVSARFLF